MFGKSHAALAASSRQGIVTRTGGDGASPRRRELGEATALPRGVCGPANRAPVGGEERSAEPPNLSQSAKGRCPSTVLFIIIQPLRRCPWQRPGDEGSMPSSPA